MITCYFGVPRVGKNTFLTKFARREILRQKLHRFIPFISCYDHIYTDFYVKGCEQFEYNYLKKYKFYNSLVLIEEMGIDADNRNFKNFTKQERDFFVLHGHLGCDLIYATQDYSMVDFKIRALTQELWYMSKSVVPFLRNFTVAKRIYRQMNINEHTSELTLGYRFCNLIESLFASNIKLCFRPFYYRFFDSYDEGSLADRPVLESKPWASGGTDSNVSSRTEKQAPPGAEPRKKQLLTALQNFKKTCCSCVTIFKHKSNGFMEDLNSIAEEDSVKPEVIKTSISFDELLKKYEEKNFIN